MNYLQAHMAQSISYIVSCYDRPDCLICCLASLKLQTHKNYEIIVTDNSTDEETMEKHRKTCEQFGAKYMNTRAITCYHSAEMGAKVAVGRYLCFPSDDSYYMPKFGESLLQAAHEHDAAFAFCEMIHNEAPPTYTHRVRGVKPRLGYIDKTGFIVRRDLFPYFPCKPVLPVPCGADGLLIEYLKKAGAKYVKIDDVLVVHN
jgi:GT2 family glycosyltransferase